MATQFKIAQPVEYYKKFLEQDVRPDGRELGEVRPTVLSVGSISSADGSALVKLGNTTVVCGIKAELTTPKSESPEHGFLVPNVDLPPLCSPKFKPGPPCEQAQAACVFMDKLVKNSNCIDLQTLCIEKGKYVWVLYCDLMCLDYDGNLLDACVVALLAALRNLLLPTVTVNEESGLAEADLEKTVSLVLQHQPVATSFSIFKNSVLLVDPTVEEESLSSGSITVVTLQDGSLCMINKPGGSCVADSALSDCISRSTLRTKEVCRLIEDSLHSLDR